VVSNADPPRRPFLRSCSFPLSVTLLSVSKSREIRKQSFLSTSRRCCCPHRCYFRLHHCPGTPHRRLRLPMLVPEAPAPGAGYAQPSAGCCTARPACMRARCGQAVPSVAVHEGKVTPVLLAFAAVLLSSWRCAAAAPAAATLF